MKMKKVTKWNASEYLESEADIVAHLNAVFEDEDTSAITTALGDIARAKGMTQFAKETGITRDSPHRHFYLQAIPRSIGCRKL